MNVSAEMLRTATAAVLAVRASSILAATVQKRTMADIMELPLNMSPSVLSRSTECLMEKRKEDAGCRSRDRVEIISPDLLLPQA